MIGHVIFRWGQLLGHERPHVTAMATKDPCLALLVCDIPISAVVRDYGEYPKIFERFFHASRPEGISAFTLDSYDVRYAMEYPKEDALGIYDGVVISGSGESIRPVELKR